MHWKDWCWCWNCNTLATWCEELTHWKRPWCWERLKVGGEVDDRGWDVWMASLTRWTWIWVSSRSWWWTGRPGVLQFWSCKVGHTEQLNWTECSLLLWFLFKKIYILKKIKNIYIYTFVFWLCCAAYRMFCWTWIEPGLSQLKSPILAPNIYALYMMIYSPNNYI